MILGVIPCKTTSNRLPRKNFHKIGNDTLLDLAIQYLGTSEKIGRIQVYTDNLEFEGIPDHQKRHPGVEFHKDPPHGGYLCDLFKAVFDTWFRKSDLKAMVCVSPDNPIRPDDLDGILDDFLESKRHEHVTYSKGYKVGALHILSREALEKGYISGYQSYSMIDGIDIHTSKDLMEARKCLIQD